MPGMDHMMPGHDPMMSGGGMGGMFDKMDQEMTPGAECPCPDGSFGWVERRRKLAMDYTEDKNFS